ncbi:MAG: class I SAM-dependent methyltransferase [Bacteroidota bacterium]
MEDRNQTTIETWDKLAAAYEEKFMDLDLYNDTYDTFCQLIEKQAAHILEIGCGPGNITKYLLAQRPDFNIDATDAAPNMVKAAQENNPTAYCTLMDCHDIDTLTTKYDAVMCGFCMPYLSKDDCRKLIKDCAYIMNSGGVLYFSTIEDEYTKSNYETSSNGEHTLFVYYHEEAYLKDYLQENNFELVTIERKDYPQAAHPAHIIFIARKK